MNQKWKGGDDSYSWMKRTLDLWTSCHPCSFVKKGQKEHERKVIINIK